MPRKARVLCDNAVYHLFNRGHNKYDLFKSERDFIVFKDIIRECKSNFMFELYNYVFMLNHFHFLTKIINAENLPKIMKEICQRYASYYRKTYGHVGYLFQNRYKSIHIEIDSYLLECARYIERNPLRAKVVKNLYDYKWSSYSFYANGTKDDIVTANPLYLDLGNNARERQERYKEYVLIPRPYEAIVDKCVASMK
ncbi:MAG: hypothetical protein A2047_02870 [Omnitrophica bacterium GWA2_41_15]|nr:MAG: hypothetical protein A2047_02870 [Omnitrophica bacterium GWA2_41_15]HAZ10119.1 hypothetical protein [Candidatus Omnitrophota bacterium]